MARIAIDVDGVLADFHKGLVSCVNKLWPGLLPPNYQPTTWSYAEVLTKREFDKAFHAFLRIENAWLSLDALPGIGDLARWLMSQRDHDVWLVTSRGESAGMTAAKQTDYWIRSCNVEPLGNFLGVIVTARPEDKAQVYEATRIEWSLDDKPETVIDTGLIGTFEHHAYLLDQPWNRDHSVHNRVQSVAEFLRKIK